MSGDLYDAAFKARWFTHAVAASHEFTEISRANARDVTRLLDEALTPQPPSEEVVEAVARLFHETYERLAPQFSYTTRKASAVPWEDVPENNRKLMIATVAEVIAAMPSIPQESEEVTEAMIMAGRQAAFELCQPVERKTAEAIYTAMTSARDRRG